MFSYIFYTFFYNPLYNGLIFLIQIVPNADVGIAIILLTLIVKFILFPLSKKAVRNQIDLRAIEPELKSIKEKYKNDRQQQAQKMMDLYRERGINPFSGLFLILIQLPIVFALYWVFFRGGLPDVTTDILYVFVSVPETINMMFLGLIDTAGRSVPLALGAAVSQYYQLRLALPPLKPRKENATVQEDFARSFQLQMKYVFPVFVFIFSYYISAAIALYWLTSNIFAIGQEYFIRRERTLVTTINDHGSTSN